MSPDNVFPTLEDFVAYVKDVGGLPEVNRGDSLSKVIDPYITDHWEGFAPPLWVRELWPCWNWASNLIQNRIFRALKSSATNRVVRRNDGTCTLERFFRN